MRGLSLVVASGGHSSSRCAGLSLSRPLLLRSTGSRHAGSAIVAHGSSCSVACGIFPTRARTRVPCIGRQIRNHCATREAPGLGFNRSHPTSSTGHRPEWIIHHHLRPRCRFKAPFGTSLVVQWLRLRAPNAGGLGSIPGQGSRSYIHAATKEPA